MHVCAVSEKQTCCISILFAATLFIPSLGSGRINKVEINACVRTRTDGRLLFFSKTCVQNSRLQKSKISILSACTESRSLKICGFCQIFSASEAWTNATWKFQAAGWCMKNREMMNLINRTNTRARTRCGAQKVGNPRKNRVILATEHNGAQRSTRRVFSSLLKGRRDFWRHGARSTKI